MRSQQELKQAKENIEDVYLWIDTILDSITLFLATCTTVYLVCSKRRRETLTWFVRIQVFLFWSQSAMFNVRNYWQLENHQLEIDRE